MREKVGLDFSKALDVRKSRVWVCDWCFHAACAVSRSERWVRREEAQRCEHFSLHRAAMTDINRPQNC